MVYQSMLNFIRKSSCPHPLWRTSVRTWYFRPKLALTFVPAFVAQLDLESPWTFQLRNPSNPAASTHAGVLEFIAREGIVHLPQWVRHSGEHEHGTEADTYVFSR